MINPKMLSNETLISWIKQYESEIDNAGDMSRAEFMKLVSLVKDLKKELRIRGVHIE